MATADLPRIILTLVGLIVVITFIVVIWEWATLSGVTTSTGTSSTKWQSNTFVERNKYMYNNSFTSDVKFTFGNNQSGEVFYAHRYVLATSSPVFYETLYSKSGGNITDIHLPHSDNETVADFFGFLYNEKCPTATNIEKGLQVLRLVMHYQVTSFDTTCKNYLKPTAQDTFTFLEQFLELKAERYIRTCFNYIDTFADGYFTSSYFLNIKLGTLDVLLRRDTLADYSEVKLFKAVVKWVDHQCSLQNLETSYENRRKILGNVIYNIRFLLMTLDEFTTDVIGVDILNDQESIGIIKTITGHLVQDLIWDSPGLRRQRTSKLITSWRTYGTVIIIVCGPVGFWCFYATNRKEKKLDI